MTMFTNSTQRRWTAMLLWADAMRASRTAARTGARRALLSVALLGMFSSFLFTATPLRAEAAGEVSLKSCQQMQVGSAGPCVRAVQKALRDRGIVVEVDGVYGPATRAGVVAAQQLPGSGLAVDGIAGPRTLAFLATPPAAPQAPTFSAETDCGNVTCSVYFSRSTTAALAGLSERNPWVKDAVSTANCLIMAGVAGGAGTAVGTPLAGGVVAVVVGVPCAVVSVLLSKFAGEAKNAAEGNGCLRVRTTLAGAPIWAYNDGGFHCRD